MCIIQGGQEDFPCRKEPGRAAHGFKPEYVEQAAKLCKLGAIDADLADFFDVSEVTINAWKHALPEFLKSLNEANEEADNAVVRSLYQWRSPDGAKRNPGPASRESRISLRSIRAT